ncbi:thiol reductant ABC exporter subunit CydD [Microbacterium sp. 10M-3C3]|uniref:thiol reductant ABC exporter subunit CydD n=1 Tax=Microbacterium sp. 10M-3C3 TaxID=2483401 RepID=UPI000F640CD5|nr:thiol reductant ABC exporter subunit CydD [Microbacterium sp. 10M-3C3]
MRPVDPRLLRYARASRGFLAATTAIALAQAGVVVGIAWGLTTALVGAIGGAPVASLARPLLVAAALVLVRAVLAVAAEYAAARGGAAAARELRDALVGAVRRRGPAWLSARNAAALSVTAGHGLDALEGYFSRYLPQLVATVVLTPILLGAIALADPLSALIVVLTLPLIPVFMVLIGLATRAVQKRQYDTLTGLAARFADTVEGLGTLKAYGRDRRAADGIGAVTRRYARETMAVLRVSFLSGFALEFLAAISVAIVAVTIGFRLLAGEMELLPGLFVLLLAPDTFLPLRQVGVQFHAAAEGVAATEDVFAVLDADRADALAVPDAAVAAPRGTTLTASALRVRRGAQTLPPVDLVVRPGRVTWLRGPSGAGKSSVVAALLGFAVVADGAIRVDGRAVPDIRASAAWAGQTPGLVAGTVAENVALGAAEPDAALVARCLADAAADELDPELALGPRGTGLSGGQAQRVAVARALYRLRERALPFLVLDEPTSALDPGTEDTLWRRIRRAADDGAGVLLVSHRESAAAIADDVVSLAAQPVGGAA